MNSNDAVTRLAQSLARYQALVVGGLGFIVLFAVTVMGVLLWQSFSIGAQSQRLEAVARETHNSLCALYRSQIDQNAQSRDFLSKNPRGLLDNGDTVLISVEQIQRLINSRQATIDAMAASGLECAGGEGE